MAKPIKNKVDYFPHVTETGKTIYVLESDFGNDGYAFWFKLLEILGRSEGHYYDLRDPANKRYLLAKVKVNEETAIDMLNLLNDVEAIDKQLWKKHRVVWIQNFVDGIASVYKKRNRPVPEKPIFKGDVIVKESPQETTTDLKKMYAKDSLEYYLARFLQSKIKEGNKAFIVKGERQIQKWAHDIDLMIRVDKRNPRELAYIIKWATEDNFWSGNILSASKLRKQYAQLWKKAGRHFDNSKPVDVDKILKKGGRDGYTKG